MYIIWECSTKHEITDQPWVKIATDLFSLDNKDYVIVVDYTSKFFEISSFPNTKPSTVINHTKAIFLHYGIPREVVSDNGPKFTSYEYKNISQEWDFKHITTSPRYPKSNGFVERNKQTSKRALQKSLRTGDDSQMTLLMLRTAPLRDGSPAPATKLMSRTFYLIHYFESIIYT